MRPEDSVGLDRRPTEPARANPAIHGYANSIGQPKFPIPWKLMVDPVQCAFAGQLTDRQLQFWLSIIPPLSSLLPQMLDRNPRARPKARRLEVAWHTVIVDSEPDFPPKRRVRSELKPVYGSEENLEWFTLASVAIDIDKY
jgi:hypothetical protein